MVDISTLTKRYYSISEVAELLGVTNSLLRYWESEFTTIKPTKGRNGIRKYTVKDVSAINDIYDLLKNQKFTIEGAKEHLKSVSKTEQHDTLNLSKIHARLSKIKRALDDLINETD